VLSIAKLAAGQEAYFLEADHERVDATSEMAGGAAAYYVDLHEAPGRWPERAPRGSRSAVPWSLISCDDCSPGSIRRLERRSDRLRARTSQPST